MSQEKVDRYKQEKVNRKQIMRKQKLMNNMRKGVLVVVALALIGWLGYSAYDIYESGKERTVSEVNYDAVSDSQLRTGTGPAVCGQARRRDDHHYAPYSGQGVRFPAGQGAL